MTVCRITSVYEGPVMALDISRDGRRVASCGASGPDVYEIRLATWSSPFVGDPASGSSLGNEPVHALRFLDPQDRRLAGWKAGAWANESAACQVDVSQQGALRAVIHLPTPRFGVPARAFDCSRDGRLSFVGDQDGMVSVWMTGSMTVSHRMKGHFGEVLAVCVSPDGAAAASGGQDASLRLWDLQGRRQRASAMGFGGPVHSVSYAANGGLLASGGADRVVRVHDASSGAARRQLEGHTDRVLAVAASQDGVHIASGSEDGTVRVWDTRMGPALHIFSDAQSAVTSVAMSSDGQTIACGAEDGRVSR